MDERISTGGRIFSRTARKDSREVEKGDRKLGNLLFGIYKRVVAPPQLPFSFLRKRDLETIDRWPISPSDRSVRDPDHYNDEEGAPLNLLDSRFRYRIVFLV